MPRIARIVIPGLVHHIVQRGNNRLDVFFVDDDRRAYLEILRTQCERYAMEVLGYCLLTNHVHLIAIPHEEDSLCKAVGRTHFVYTQYVNRLHGRSGHLWQNRFYSCALDEEHFWAALGYVERNPVRAGIVRKAWRYRWSSAPAHCGERDTSGVLDLQEWERLLSGWSMDWRDVLARPEDEELTARVRSNLNRGRPLGSDRFLSKLEAKLGVRLRPLPIGRPRKNKNRNHNHAKQNPKIGDCP